ncbi:protein TRACHEARY ELEMENT DIFFERENTIATION-RELATED 6-like [Arachis stenosperma]|uniref:protein TRACHEARY ELEMENT DIFFERENTIATION-RELATED 6-like n=1 Tax=Arachis stenosperma TaxID=217475 RepID=UPI0025ACFFF2|nr:protein TRACHEARY ELEMENT DIFFERENTIATION-RELATED 6-like [Arachis stenosperma]
MINTVEFAKGLQICQIFISTSLSSLLHHHPTLSTIRHRHPHIVSLLHHHHRTTLCFHHHTQFQHHPTIIVIVFVSFGGLLFLSVLAFALFCLIKKMKKKKQETDIIHFDEHRHFTEAIVPGPCGEQVVVLSVDDDVHIDEEIIKNEEFGHALQEKQSSTANEGNDP